MASINKALRSLTAEWYTPGERKSQDRLRFLLSNYNMTMIKTLKEGTFLTGLLLLMQIDEYIIGSGVMLICYIANTFQLLSPVIFERLQKRKKLILTLRTISYVTEVMLMGLVPLLPMTTSAKSYMLMGMLFFSSIVWALYNPAMSTWQLQSLTEQSKPSFFSLVASGNSIVAMATGLLGGVAVDAFKAAGHEYEGLLLLRVIGLCVYTFDFCLYLKVREYPYESTGNRISLKKVLVIPLKDKLYRKSILFPCLYYFIMMIPGSYMAVYLLNDLNVGYTVYSLFCAEGQLLISLATILLWRPRVKSIGWMRSVGLGMLMASVIHVFISFTTKGNVLWYYPLLTLVNGIMGAALTSLALSCICYHNIPQADQSVYTSAYLALTNLAAALGTIAGRFIMVLTGNNTFTLLGVAMCNKQYIYLLTGILGILGGLYIWLDDIRDRHRYARGE